MRKRLITIVSYLSIIFFAPFLLGANAEAALCPGTTSDYTCTYVDPTTCIASDVSMIPAYASTDACETCRAPGVTARSIGYTWLNYPSGGTPNSGEPYIHIPTPAATTYQTVHLYSSRLGCSGRAETEYLIGTDPLVGVMSIKNGSELSFDSGDFSDFMNQKLEQYAASYNTYRDPIYESMLTPSLKTFSVLPLNDTTSDGWTHRDFLNITVSRNNPYGENYMQLPGTNITGVINIPEAMSRCEAGGQFATDNDCDLTIYIGAGAEKGYAVLDMVAYLKIKRVLPTAAITFLGNVVSNPESTAKIGDSITFTHSMGASYFGDIRNARADYVFSGNAIDSPSAPRTIGPINYLNTKITYQSATATETHTVTLADAQRGYVCRTISWTSSATTPVPTNSPAERSVQRCVTINYSYDLTPSVTVPDTVEPGASITPKPKVTRVGDPLSVNSNWTLTRVILPASNTTNFGTAPVTNATAPSTHYNNLSGTVSELHGSGSNEFSADSTDLAVDDFTDTGELQLGQRVCFGLSVRPYTNTSETDYKHSALACATISKSPSAQIHGGGLLVAEGKVIGSSSKKQSTTFGSWVEYDITANGTVDEMVASAMGYGLQGTALGIGSHLQKLTFANKTVYGNFGSANNLSHSLVGGSLTNPYSFFKDSADPLAALSVAPSGLPFVYGQTKVYTHTGNITLNASTLSLGQQIVLIVENGNIYIDGDQTYASGITDPKSLPQLVLIAHNGNIIIDQAVTNVDAWLIANSDPSNASKGQLWTCSIKPTNSKPTDSTQCDDQLVINGPVMVDYLKLYRIYGADYSLPLGFGLGGLNDPAEVFNLRPDAYIWSLQNSQSSTILKTTHIKDLAPRY